MDELKLEPEFREVYDVWKKSPTVESNRALLDTLNPDIDKIIHTHVGAPNPLLRSRARQLALKGMQTYDPAKAKIRTHLYSQLKSLKRYAGQQRHILQVPERVVLDRNYLGRVQQELEDELGREPADQELADRTGFSMSRIRRVRQYHQPVNTGLLSTIGSGGYSPAVAPTGNDIWLQVVYDDLGPIDKKIFEYSLGYNGKPVLSNQEIASRLGRSPGAISQRKLLIQQLLSQEGELSPF